MTVELTKDELRIIKNALNEVCNGIHPEGECDTRMGCTDEEARQQKAAQAWAAEVVPSCQLYSTAFSGDLLAGSTQFAIQPVLSINRVIGNCGAQSMSRPLKLPVMLAARKPANAPSSRWTPPPPLPVIVGP